MDDARYRLLADQTFRRILDAFDDIDVEDADVETAGGVIRIDYRGGERCVINTQAATHQIWLAGAKSGWHFSYDEDGERWMHDKGTGDELFAVLERLTRDATGLELDFG